MSKVTLFCAILYLTGQGAWSAINGRNSTGRLVRQPRQTLNACKSDSSKFQCKTNPDCIEVDQMCDGKENCPDGSDEKQSICQNVVCPGYLFQCEYGACISADQRCNGQKDCKDNSDETDCPSAFEKVNTNCRSDQFECDNGECIDTDGRCNGVAECQDKSDETEALCLNIECPGYTYKCRYGACVDGTARCNGIKECFDNSDEDEKTCGSQRPTTPVTPGPSTEPPGPQNYCVTPNQPDHGSWTYFHDETQTARRGERVPPKTQLIFKCAPRFRLSTGHDRNEEIVYCRSDGQWSSTIFPSCLGLCAKYHNQNHAIVQCKLDGSIIPCDKATHGTQLTYKCEPYYEPATNYLLNVCRDGSWAHGEPRCSEVCGEKQVSAQTLVVNGRVVKRGSYPWVTALYSNKDSERAQVFVNVCGGSLLTTSIVLTAAHCVSTQENGQLYHIKYFRVAAGKYYNRFMDDRDQDTAQYKKVKQIVKHPDYRGEKQNFGHDIALLKLETAFALSKVVQPVCFNKLPSLSDSGIATITGWGYTTTSGDPSDVLNEIDLEYVDNEKCHTELDQDFAERYLIADKMCAGFVNKSMGVCKGDSGGGLVVKQNNRYFVQGIVSLAHAFKGGNEIHCNLERRALFTRVSTYIDWIQYQVQLLI